MRVRAALEQLPVGALRRMGALHGLTADDATTRAELVERLGERLADPAYLREQLTNLTDDEHAALVAARASGGELRGFALERDEPGVASSLVERGLLVRTFTAAGPRRGELFALPDELVDVLPEPPAPEPPPAAGEPPPARRAGDPAFSLFALASTLGRPGADLAAEVGAWSEEPGGWEWHARWDLLRHLALGAGLFDTRTDGELVWTRVLLRVLRDPPALADRLWRAYVQDRGWSDLEHSQLDTAVQLVLPEGRTPAAAPETPAVAASTPPPVRADFVQAPLLRASLIAAIEQLPEGAWMPLADFDAWLQRTAPDVLREQLDSHARLLLEPFDWAAVEAPLVRYLLLGPLYWLGAIACSADGAHIARRGPLRTPAVEPCTWDGASVLLAPPRCDLATLLEAERYLVLDERGRPSRYRLVQQHVAAALSAGGSIDECERLLSRLSSAPLADASAGDGAELSLAPVDSTLPADGGLPPDVAHHFAAWRARYGALAIRPAVLLETRSRAELDAALGEDAVQPFVGQRLGPTSAEVAAADALELAAALRASGHLPRVDAALRLASEPRRSYAGLVDEQVLEFLLVSLLAFERARPERLAELEGAPSLLERLERQFSPEKLSELHGAAERLAGELRATPRPSRRRGATPRPRRRPGARPAPRA